MKATHRRPTRRLVATSGVFVLLALIGSVGYFLHAKQRAVEAVTGSEFNAGRIIDNDVFYNKNTMTAAQIQNFLNGKVPNCDSQGTQAYAGTTRRAYSEARGEAFPLVCLKDYRENTTTKDNNLQGKTIAGASKSAAEIIADVSQTYSINPQVLLVLLEKEQRLISDDWPWQIQYRSATGYGCPDTAPCDSEYYGFYNQVKNAASQFRRYADNPNNYNYVPGQNNNIRFNPNASCGSSTVFIQNQATATLYNYTPYQPNQSALNNLYGTGDNCGAYGNRNFWRLFNDWFGSTIIGAATNAADKQEVQKRIKTVTFNNNLYIFYYDSFQSAIRMAAQNQSTGQWQYSVLDGSSKDGNGRINASLGSDITATVYNGSLQLFYYDRTGGNLRHAWSTNGTAWNFETLDGAASSVSRIDGDVGTAPTAITYNGSLQLYYYDKTLGNLRHTWADVNGWHFETLDGDAGAVSARNSDVGLNSTAMVSDGQLQLFYYDRLAGLLRHAWTGANGWNFENLDGDPNSIAQHSADVGQNATVTAYGTSIQLFYYDKSYGNLRHAWAGANGWNFENLDGDPNAVGRYSSDLGTGITTTTFGPSLQVYYYDRASGNLRHAWAGANGWNFENLDGDAGSVARFNGDVGSNADTTTFNTSLQLYYFNKTDGRLRHAWVGSGNWSFEDLGPPAIY